MADRDLLVIGGGVTGLSAALAAAEAGARVTVVDEGRDAGSGANAGSLHVQMQSRFLRLNPHLAPNVEASLPLYLAAVREWERLDALLGGVELVREGGLMLAEDSAQMAFLERKAEREARRGLSVELLGSNELTRLAPWIGPGVAGAELCRDEGKLNPLLANARLAERLEALGAERVRDRIRRLDPGPPVEAEGEATHRADRAILATAWGTGALVRPLGLKLDTPPEPLHMNVTEPARPTIHHLVQHAERMITLKQLASGQVVIGGGWPAERRDDGAPQVLRRSLVGNVALAARIAPGLAGLRVIRSWAGLNTPVDGKATIGPVEPGGRVHLALPGDAGYTLGPVVGRAAAAVAMGLDPPVDPTPFSVDRWR